MTAALIAAALGLALINNALTAVGVNLIDLTARLWIGLLLVVLSTMYILSRLL